MPAWPYQKSHSRSASSPASELHKPCPHTTSVRAVAALPYCRVSSTTPGRISVIVGCGGGEGSCAWRLPTHERGWAQEVETERARCDERCPPKCHVSTGACLRERHAGIHPHG